MEQIQVNPRIKSMLKKMDVEQVDPKLLESMLLKAEEVAQNCASNLPVDSGNKKRYLAMPSYDGKSGIIFYEG